MPQGAKYIVVRTNLRPEDEIAVGLFLNGPVHMSSWIKSFREMLASLSSELGIREPGIQAELAFTDHPLDPEQAFDPEKVSELGRRIRNQFRDWYVEQ